MTANDIDSIIDEFYASRLPLRDPALSALEAALFLEECLSLTLTDSDIASRDLGSREALRDIALDKLGV